MTRRGSGRSGRRFGTSSRVSTPSVLRHARDQARRPRETRGTPLDERHAAALELSRWATDTHAARLGDEPAWAWRSLAASKEAGVLLRHHPAGRQTHRRTNRPQPTPRSTRAPRQPRRTHHLAPPRPMALGTHLPHHRGEHPRPAPTRLNPPITPTAAAPHRPHAPRTNRPEPHAPQHRQTGPNRPSRRPEPPDQRDKPPPTPPNPPPTVDSGLEGRVEGSGRLVGASGPHRGSALRPSFATPEIKQGDRAKPGAHHLTNGTLQR